MRQIKNWRVLSRRSISIALSILFVLTPCRVGALTDNQQLQQQVYNRGLGAYDVQVDCGTATSDTTLSDNADMNERLQYIYTWLRGRGLTPIQAAAAIGNISVESGGSPTIVEHNKKWTGKENGIPASTNDPASLREVDGWIGNQTRQPGWGIIQWTPARKVIGIAKDAGVSSSPIYRIDTQLQILLWHMKNVSPTGYKNMLGGYTQTNVGEAVQYFERTVEGAAVPAIGVRTSRAKVALEKYESQIPSAYTDGSATAVDTGASDAVDGASSSGCAAEGSTTISGSFATLATAYVWPYEWRSGKSPDGKASSPTEKTKEYDDATKAAIKAGKWVGNNGVDCGGFVTRIVQNSFDSSYNTANSGHGGNTAAQLAWLQKSDHWKEISAGQDATYYKPGDVGVYPGHTLIFVGSIAKYWWEGSNGQLYSPDKVTVTGDVSGTVKSGNGKIKVHRVLLASASDGKRAPMADKDETIGSNRYHWFRYTGSTSTETN